MKSVKYVICPDDAEMLHIHFDVELPRARFTATYICVSNLRWYVHVRIYIKNVSFVGAPFTNIG